MDVAKTNPVVAEVKTQTKTEEVKEAPKKLETPSYEVFVRKVAYKAS